MELNSFQTHQLTRRLPHIELSYETIPHKKVSPEYNICIAIPVGKKCYLWYTFYDNENVCFLMELNREKKPFKATLIERGIDPKLAKGTLLYGTVFEEIVRDSSTVDSSTIEVFIADDILHYEGNTTRGLQYDVRLGILATFMSKCDQMVGSSHLVHIALPMLWPIKKDTEYECIYELPEEWAKCPGYITHHVQYRCLKQSAPYYNIIPTRKAFAIPAPAVANKMPELMPDYGNVIRCDYSKQIYRQTATFIVTADIQFDVYHLFAYGRNKQKAYCGIAGVPNYKTSVYLNGIFRRIRENQNLDAIEESDDEADFENPAEDKWVDLHKQVQMECVFHYKFKKWVPTKILNGWNKIVHISQL